MDNLSKSKPGFVRGVGGRTVGEAVLVNCPHTGSAFQTRVRMFRSVAVRVGGLTITSRRRVCRSGDRSEGGAGTTDEYQFELAEAGAPGGLLPAGKSATLRTCHLEHLRSRPRIDGTESGTKTRSAKASGHGFMWW